MAALWSIDPKHAINIGKGHLNPDFLPLQEVQDALVQVAAKPESHVALLQYGRMQGPPQLCNLIAELLKRYSGRIDRAPTPENVLVTTGAGPGLFLVCQLFSKPGDLIFVDSPGYFLSFSSFNDCGLTVVNIPTDAHGMDVNVIERLLKEGKRPSLLYTVPIANNPTGVSYSEDRKRRLVQLAREYNFKIMADEVYQFLTFDDEFPVSFFEHDDPLNPTVFSINSFSKILGPGMRLGWILTHKEHMDVLLSCGPLQSGGGFNPFMGAVVSQMIDNSFFDAQVKRLQSHFQMACSALCDAVDKHICTAVRDGEVVTYHRPRGGFFCFVNLPDRFNTQKLLDTAKECGVSYFAGCNSSPDKSLFTSSMRLCFGWLDTESIVEAVKRLGMAMKQYSEKESN